MTPTLILALFASLAAPTLKPNRLAAETSPYLRQHGHNPVAWYPWGTAAFARAKAENKFVFLSVGYSACHWCHVMERESFSDPEIVAILNRNFISIKVDREERPDVDEAYLAALSATGVGGGWPMSVFLTADAKPIFGGTYWPPRDRVTPTGTATGFLTVLKRVMDLTETNRAGLIQQADRVAEMAKKELARPAAPESLKLDAGVVKVAGEAFEFDPVYGGFGQKSNLYRGTRFPRAPALLFLISRCGTDKPLAESLKLTLEKLATGGTRDQLGGGFHRYSTERTWGVPHFEKMLYNQGQLIEVYARAAGTASGDRELDQFVALDTARFLREELQAPGGAFYASIDADSRGEEGAFTVWTPAELDAVLGGDTKPVREKLGMTGPPNYQGKAYVPRLSGRDALLTMLPGEAMARAKLLAARSKRPRPTRDDKILAGWNGLTIGGLAAAGKAFDDPQSTAMAVKAANFVLTNMRHPDGRLGRVYAEVPGQGAKLKGQGFLDDYADMTHGLLNLYEATTDKKWLAAAEALTAIVLRDFPDRERGGFFLTPDGAEALFVRGKDHYDGATPSAAGLTARNLARLAELSGDANYRAEAEKAVRAFAVPLTEFPQSCPVTADALRILLETAK